MKPRYCPSCGRIALRIADKYLPSEYVGICKRCYDLPHGYCEYNLGIWDDPHESPSEKRLRQAREKLE